MQISRHWRMNAQRYQLVGVRYENGEISVQDRPITVESAERENEPETVQVEATHEAVATAA